MSGLFDGLRQNIRRLKADGDDGFEGLMAAVLTDVTCRSFAIASSGSQRGRDGQSALDEGVVVFEAKRYDDSLPKDKILTKIAEIAGDSDSKTELYIVGCTSPISAQHVSSMQKAGKKLGMVVLALGWPTTGLSELAVFVALTPQITAEFVARHTTVPVNEILEQIEAVRADPQFQARADEIQGIVRQPSVSPAFALADNALWLKKVFSDTRHARMILGQPLSPADMSTAGIIDRPELRTKVNDAIFSGPKDAIVGILGADGNGKSWAFAQAWCHQPSQPLTVVIVPDDVGLQISREICVELLVSKLIAQTGDSPKTEVKDRWLGHLERWRTNKEVTSPRIVVFVDGVNQREAVDWQRFLDVMSEVVAEVGGKLVFSCRTIFYRNKLENGLTCRVQRVDVPEWSNMELDELLSKSGTSTSELDARLVGSLRNPRIFAVAMSLFKRDEITAFGELSVSRLLFEHIRSGNATLEKSMDRSRFAAEIRRHADDIVQRLKKNEHDGLNEFDMSLTGIGASPTKSVVERFAITSAGHFFEMIEGEPDKYVLRDEGLPLAMGLAIVSSVRTALRQGKSVENALSSILDPIAALELTSDILLGAILAAVVNNEAEVVTPLVHSFVSLQNIDAGRFPEFRNLFGTHPDAFLKAIESLAIGRSNASSFFWLTEAADALTGVEKFEKAQTEFIQRWLGFYSLAPERMISVPDVADRAEEYRRRREERQQELDASIDSMSADELLLLGEMIREDKGDYGKIGLIAFQALAGRPLAPFARSLVKCCLSFSLNGGYWNHRDVFYDLVRFNVDDWEATRQALLDFARSVFKTSTSTVGKWALIYALQSTGASDDAREAMRIVDSFRDGDATLRGWRLVEDYCATDPCDPMSLEPENIADTAAAYSAINPAHVRTVAGGAGEDHRFILAQPGLARFRPDAAAAVLRALADQCVSRDRQNFFRVIPLLAEQTAALDQSIVVRFVERAREIAQAAMEDGEDTHNEAWVAAQFALCVSFPHMTGDEQFEALINHPKDATVMMEVAHLLRPVGSMKIEHALEQAIRESNPVRQFRILLFAEYSGTPLTGRTTEMVIGLLASEEGHVRLSVLSLIRATAKSELLKGLVESGWSAGSLDAVSRKVEIYHGSLALVLAAESGYITIEGCLDRVDFSAFELLAQKLGGQGASAVAERLDVSIRNASKFQVIGNLPDIEQNVHGRHWPVVYQVSHRATPEESAAERLRRTIETGNAWYDRQEKNLAVADQFERDLIKVDAQLIIRVVTVELMRAIDKANETYVDSWAGFIVGLTGQALCNVHNAGMVIAEVLSQRDANMGQKLFDHLKASRPQVRVTFGRSKVDIEASTMWGAAVTEEMKERCFSRLDQLGNDHELAMEVIACFTAQRVDLLREYVSDRQQRVEPSLQARAAMVAGLAPNEPWAAEAVEQLADTFGFLKDAYLAARYAMDRHQWSREWASRMRVANEPIELWRYAVLLSKIVDGRFDWGELSGDTPSDLIRRFGPTLERGIRDRIGKWKSKRRSKLFGMNSPDRVFLGRRKAGFSR
jgi:hypothetical protein